MHPAQSALRRPACTTGEGALRGRGTVPFIYHPTGTRILASLTRTRLASFLFFFSFILCLDGRAGPMMYPLWAQAGCVCHSRSTRCNVQLDLLHHPHCLFFPAF